MANASVSVFMKEDLLADRSKARSLPWSIFDLLLAILFVLTIYLSASLFGWNQAWVRWSETLEFYGLGQLPFGMAAAALAFAWYAWRRARESEQAKRRWKQAVGKLQLEAVQREHAEASERKARRSLERHLQTQKRRTLHIGLVREMGEYILSAKSRLEILEISSRYLERLLPFHSGAIFLLRGNQQSLKPVKAWGRIELKEEPKLEVQQCWAIRRNRLFEEEPSDRPGLCGHLPQNDHSGLICVPIICRTQQFGILHFRYGPNHDDEEWLEKRYSERKETLELASALGETLGLYLYNHGLREKLAKESSRDPLTGLLNRRGLEKAVTRELHQHDRDDFRLCLIMLDVDHFKKFNDTYGHDAGDLVLSALAELLSKHVRARDILCRYGGEEFIIVMPNTAVTDVTPHLQDMLVQVAKMPLVFDDAELPRVTISMGLAAWREDAHEWEELVRCADTALYAAKQAGRNRLLRYRPEMN